MTSSGEWGQQLQPSQVHGQALGSKGSWASLCPQQASRNWPGTGTLTQRDATQNLSRTEPPLPKD